MIHKIRTYANNPSGRVFSWLVMVTALGVSFVFPFFPTYVEGIVGTDELVSLFYAGMAVVVFFAALVSTYVFERYERSSIVKWSLVLSFLSFLVLVIINDVVSLSIVDGLKLSLKLFILMALTLYVRDFTKKKDFGKEEGFFYRSHNIGLFLGPLIGGFLAAYMGYELVFILSALVIFGCYLYFHSLHVSDKHPVISESKKVRPINFNGNIKDFFSSVDRAKAFVITLVLMMWSAFKNLYIPLYVVHSGYLESMGGLVLALGILPLILLEVKVGEYAGKQGFRLPITWGFLIMGVSLVLIFLSPFVLLNFFMLIVMNVGMALVEPVQEIYLFQNMKKEDEDRLYGIYMTADPIAFFVTPAIGALILHFFTFNYLFLFFALINLVTAFYFNFALIDKHAFNKKKMKKA